MTSLSSPLPLGQKPSLVFLPQPSQNFTLHLCSGGEEGKESRSSFIQQLEGVRDLNLPRGQMIKKNKKPTTQKQEVRFEVLSLFQEQDLSQMSVILTTGSSHLQKNKASEHNGKVLHRLQLAKGSSFYANGKIILRKVEAWIIFQVIQFIK